MDFFVENRNVIERLLKEWIEHKNLIIAYDYDNTVYDYYQKGHKFNQVINLLQECKKVGAYCILYTCCEEEKYPAMRKYLEENEIPCDSINKNAPFIPFTGDKLYYNILLDDRAGLSSAVFCLRIAMEVMKQNPEDYTDALWILHEKKCVH